MHALTSFLYVSLILNSILYYVPLLSLVLDICLFLGDVFGIKQVARCCVKYGSEGNKLHGKEFVLAISTGG
jgi:hypothetical protein